MIPLRHPNEIFYVFNFYILFLHWGTAGRLIRKDLEIIFLYVEKSIYLYNQ
jgi:hypothetical protein